MELKFKKICCFILTLVIFLMNYEISYAKDSKILVAYFSCTGTTKNLAKNVADILNADLYEIKPQNPYSSEDLNYNNKMFRANLEQRNNNARPALADKNANIEQYQTIVIAYPIWWGTAPRIIDTFFETYNFEGKIILPICTSGGSDITSSAEHLKAITKGSVVWKVGKRFGRASLSDLKIWLESQNL